MEKIKDLQYYKENAEENYLTTPISVLRYITELEQALQLHKTQVSGSVCCDNQSLRWEKKEISIDDKNGSYKDLTFDFCENCGKTFNEEFS